ncbi:YggS family pyridoxal phosphate enzyme [Spirochaetia bacterium]|nr:YggS family pyridoxal phosphate enzyme [Spirochaetia bacterium]
MAIRDNLAQIEERLRAACRRAGRSWETVRIMGVSKFHPAAKLDEAWDAGLRLFGESRVQEAAVKFAGFKDGHPGTELHMIGSLQRNKVKTAVPLFDCVESVDREELIAELGILSADRDRPLPILLELNSGEASKSGFPDEDSLFRAAEKVLAYPGIISRGLMTMAPLTDDPVRIRAAFRALAHAAAALEQRFPGADWSCLSMGMSGDFEIAVEEGSTVIRIGTAIFGEREG